MASFAGYFRLNRFKVILTSEGYLLKLTFKDS